VISEETAYEFSGSGRTIQKNAGTISNSEEVTYAIIEFLTSTLARVGVDERNGPNFVGTAEFDNKADVVSTENGTIEANARALGRGPNGGELVHCQIRYDPSTYSGNDRGVSLYPDRNGNGKSCVFHHAQTEESYNASTPIVTGLNAKTRERDNYTFFSGAQPDWWNPNEGTFLFSVVPRAYNYKFNDILNFSQNERVEFDNGSPSRVIFVDKNNTPDVNLKVENLNNAHTPSKFALSVENNSKIILSVNGSSDKDSSYSGTPLSTSDLYIKPEEGLIATIGSLSYFPRALPESTLNTLTT
jgi:hypothetical protein